MNGILLFPVADESIGTARTDRRGRFRLTTTTGFATKLSADSPDRRQEGAADVSRRSTQTHIKVSPEFRKIRYRAIDPLSPGTEKAAAAVKEIMNEVVRNDGQLESLAEYWKRGIISKEAFDLFAKNPGLYFGQDREAEYQWGDEIFVIQDTTSKIKLVAAKRKE